MEYERKACLVGDTARLKTGDKDEGDGLPVIDGINKIRETLGRPGHIVRLVGLSGVGRTRFVEALFYATHGVNSLDPSLAFYTDITSDPTPSPAGLASDLIATQTRAILVIDNCQPGRPRFCSVERPNWLSVQSRHLRFGTLQFDAALAILDSCNFSSEPWQS
jgi:hypothetical protein